MPMLLLLIANPFRLYQKSCSLFALCAGIRAQSRRRRRERSRTLRQPSDPTQSTASTHQAVLSLLLFFYLFFCQRIEMATCTPFRAYKRSLHKFNPRPCPPRPFKCIGVVDRGWLRSGAPSRFSCTFSRRPQPLVGNEKSDEQHGVVEGKGSVKVDRKLKPLYPGVEAGQYAPIRCPRQPTLRVPKPLCCHCILFRIILFSLGPLLIAARHFRPSSMPQASS
ncbi:hypothetical protein F5Y12DRAFT_164565 [Xylaria sp. FL1777]|nr:hypothetical protein F5Y12DRAFT_164565 [Xylaria sp. FL1777]